MTRPFFPIMLGLFISALIWRDLPSPWRLATVVIALAALVPWVAVQLARWRHARRHLHPVRARMYYVGVHPLLRSRRWVNVTAAPEGLVVDMGRWRGWVVLKYGRLLRTLVAQETASGWRYLEFYYQDLISQRDYSMRFYVRYGDVPDGLHGAIERWIYRLADVNWALWRGLSLSLPVTAEERRHGGERDFSYIRQAACLPCGGNEGYNLACWQCAGRGVINENAYARVKIPRHSRIGQQIVIAGGGNEDLNGNHGPLTLRLVDAKESGELRPVANKSPRTAAASEPTAARKDPVDLNDLLPTRRTGPIDLNGDGPRDLNGAAD